jgi:hypothetical protein
VSDRKCLSPQLVGDGMRSKVSKYSVDEGKYLPEGMCSGWRSSD